MINYKIINDMIGQEWVYIENDCIAVVRKAAKLLFNIEIPYYYLPDISDMGVNSDIFKSEQGNGGWVRVENPSPGDVVVFYNRHRVFIHVGIYIDYGRVLHCPGTNRRPGKTVFEKLSKMPKYIYRSYEVL